MDISMPDMTGWEVAKQMRMRPGLSGTKIVIVSANGHEFNPGDSEYAPHDAFVMKPVDIQILLECIGTVLSLEWKFEAPPEVADAANSDAKGIAAANHTHHHFDDLYQLGRIGHVRGIQSKLDELEVADPAAKPFATHLRKLITNFDLKSYMQAIEAMRKNG
jgi:CheY-like chemotaxis protein